MRFKKTTCNEEGVIEGVVREGGREGLAFVRQSENSDGTEQAQATVSLLAKT